MKPILFILLSGFFISFSLGQITAIQLIPGVSIYLHDFIAGGIILMTFMRYVHQKTFTKPFLIIPIISFVGIALCSAISNAYRFPFNDVISGILYLVRWILYTSLYICVLELQIPIWWWMYGLYGSGVSISVIGIFQFIYFPALKPLTSLGWDEHYGRLFSTLLDPNFAGSIIVLSIILGTFFLFEKKYKSFRLFFFLFELIQLVALGLTFSRSSYLAFVVAAILGAFFTKNKTFIIGLLALIIIYIFIPKTMLDVNRLNRTASTIARIDSWEESIQVFTERPMLGHGFNYLRALAKQKKTLDEFGIISRDAGGVNSSLLFVLETTGIIGFVIYIFLLIKNFQLFYAHKNGMWRAIGITSLAAIIVHSFFNHTLFYAWVMIWLWILNGIIEVTMNKKK